MHAMANLVLVTSIWATLEHSELPSPMNQAELTMIRDTIAVNATCVEIKCHGDFPLSSNRKYAEAHEAHHWS